MSKNGKDKLLWLVVALILIGQIILIWSLMSNDASGLTAVGWITGALLPVGTFLFNLLQRRSLRFFLFTNRLRSRLSTFTPTWNMAVIIRGEQINISALDNITQRLRQLESQGRAIRIKRLNPKSYHIEVQNGPTLELAFTPERLSAISELGDTDLPYIRVRIGNYRVSLAPAERIFRKEIAPILETIIAAVPAAETRYNLTIDFEKENNPFFGLYIAQLPPDAISMFTIRLSMNDYSPNSYVLISESQVAVNTRTQSSFQDLALQFLTFEPTLAEHL